MRADRITTGLGLLAIAGSLVVGILLRLQDPLSTHVIPAEDPYTHMLRLQGHLDDGVLTSLREGDDMYPPGMHAVLGVVWVFTGGDLYTIFRFGPVVFGAIGVLGIALLLWRQLGPLAAFIGSLGMAMAPEIVFRTTMMAPTAMDVAVLPFLLLGLVEMLDGELSWFGPSAFLAALLVFSHPWVFGLLGLGGLAYLALLVLAAPVQEPSARPSAKGLSLAMGIVGASLALVLSTCAGLCGPGFQRVLPWGGRLTMLAPILLVVSFLPAATLAVREDASERLFTSDGASHRSIGARIALGTVLAVAVVALTVPAVGQGMPRYVDLPEMIGWPLLGLAFVGLVSSAFLDSRLVLVAAALVIATYPLAIYNPLDSEFWPHRTVVYLGTGIALLAGIGADGIASAVRRAWPGPHQREGTAARTGVALLVPMVLVGGSLAGTVYAQTPEPYPGGWYRLYEECEMDALVGIAAILDGQEDPRLITGDWRPGIVVPAVSGVDAQIWFKPSFFHDEGEREVVMQDTENQDRSLFVLDERHLREATDEADRGFLDGPGWAEQGAWCQPGERAVILYRAV